MVTLGQVLRSPTIQPKGGKKFLDCLKIQFPKPEPEAPFTSTDVQLIKQIIGTPENKAVMRAANIWKELKTLLQCFSPELGPAENEQRSMACAVLKGTFKQMVTQYCSNCGK